MTDEKDTEGGAVFLASPECVAEALKTHATGRKPDFTVTNAELAEVWDQEEYQGFMVTWETVSAGFGTITLSINKKTGEVSCDLESMSKRFAKEVFSKLVDGLPDSDT